MLKTLTKEAVSLCNWALGRFHQKLFILGDGRSGTNWLIDILNFDKRYRLIYEPFHGWEFRPKLPDRAEYPWAALHGRAALDVQFRRAARGAYLTKNVSVEFPRLIYSGLLIKDINVHLALDALCAAIPGMKKVMIIRHPFAVAQSKQRYRGHRWPTTPGYFLRGEGTGHATLEPYRTLIEEVDREGDQTLQLVAIWCILHKLAFASACIGDFCFVLYEHLSSDPDSIVQALYCDLGLEETFRAHRSEIQAMYLRPSRVTQADNTINSSRRGVAAWMTSMDRQSIDRALRLLEGFDLGWLYGADHFPALDASELHDRLARH